MSLPTVYGKTDNGAICNGDLLMKLKNLAKIFSRDKETARDSNIVNHNLVPNSTLVNTDLIGASVGNGLALANGVLGVSPLETESINFTFSLTEEQKEVFSYTEGASDNDYALSIVNNNLYVF